MRKRGWIACLLIACAMAAVYGGACAAGYSDKKNVEIVRLPTVKAIVYGEDLSCAVLKGGQAADPDTGETVSGTFEWDRPDYVPGIGDQECLCWFTPAGYDADVYRATLFSLKVSVKRVELECVELPVCLREFVYGEKFKTVPILGGTVVDQYGNEVGGKWLYKSGEKSPETGSEMVEIRFDADDFLHYKGLVIEIRVTCRPCEPELSVRCERMLAGSRLKDAVLVGKARGVNGEEVPGRFRFEDENTLLTEDGSYRVVFTPEESLNYTSASCLVQVKTAEEPVRAEVSGILTEGHPLEDVRLSIRAEDRAGQAVSGRVSFIEDRTWYFRGENHVRAFFIPDDEKYAAQEVLVSLFVQSQVNVWAELFLTPGQTVGEGMYTLTAMDNADETVPGTLLFSPEDRDLTWEETDGEVQAVFIPEDGQTYETLRVPVKVVLLQEPLPETEEPSGGNGND